MSKTYARLGCVGILGLLISLILFGTYSLGSGKVMSFFTLGEGKSITFTQKVREVQGIVFLKTCMDPVQMNDRALLGS